jgi:hypothetical protein
MARSFRSRYPSGTEAIEGQAAVPADRAPRTKLVEILCRRDGRQSATVLGINNPPPA